MASDFPDAQAYSAERARHRPLAVVDLRAEQAAVVEAYRNQVLLDVNADCLRMAVFEGEYRWHRHPDSDELFLVVAGEMEIDFPGGDTARLGQWQCIVVPAGTVHRTRAIGRTVNLTCERQGAPTEFVDVPGDGAAGRVPAPACPHPRPPAGVDRERPVLHSGTRNASSWAFRAWLALKEAGVAFDEEVVDIRPPRRLPNLERIRAFSPPGAVPVLVDGGAVIFDSLAIMEYASELAGGALLPRDPRERAHARSLLAWQHAGLSGLCPRLSFESAFYPERRAMMADELSGAARIFDAWEAELTRSGGPWLCGALSLADLAFAPTVVRLHAHVPQSDFETSRWPRSEAWMAALLARDAVREWLDEARALPPVRLDEY